MKIKIQPPIHYLGLALRFFVKKRTKCDSKSEKETYIQTFKISEDTLSYLKYNKIDDAHFDYHSEKFKQKKLIKHKDRYALIQEDEGENENYIFSSNKYIVDFNEKGLESIMYKISDNDTIPYYEVNYLEFDPNGNWIQRQLNISKKKVMINVLLSIEK